MATKTITPEIEVKSCDICGKGSDHISTCQVCGSDVCPNCRAGNMCKPCWNSDYSFATVEIHTTEEGGYEGRTHTHLSLKHDSKKKWYAILERHAGARILISVEVAESVEELELKQRSKQMEGDDPTKWLERCG